MSLYILRKIYDIALFGPIKFDSTQTSTNHLFVQDDTRSWAANNDVVRLWGIKTGC